MAILEHLKFYNYIFFRSQSQKESRQLAFIFSSKRFIKPFFWQRSPPRVVGIYDTNQRLTSCTAHFFFLVYFVWTLKKAITLMPLFLVINVILVRIFHYLIHSTWADFRLIPDSHIPKKTIKFYARFQIYTHRPSV